MKKSVKKRKLAITLVELIVVMSLIVIITGAIAYNYKGTLEKGKAFKTRQAMTKIESALRVALAENRNDIASKLQGNNIATAVVLDALQSSPLIEDPKKIIKDGWGKDMEVSVDQNTNEITINSADYTNSPYK